MKRKGFLYESIYDFNHIEKAFDEVCRNSQNKKADTRPAWKTVLTPFAIILPT